MQLRSSGFSRAALAAALFIVGATLEAQSAAAPDLTGSWERYRGPAGDAATPPPEAQPPLKPIHRISGVVFSPNGDRVARAKVTVLQAGKDVATQDSDNDGKFSFDRLEAGKYEIRVQIEAFRVAATEVVLARPKAKSDREIAVSIRNRGFYAGLFMSFKA